MNSNLQYFAACPRNTSDLVVSEIKSFGGTDIKETSSGIYFSGSVETGYRFILWSRTANRLFLQLTSFPVSTPDDIYEGVRSVSWSDEFDVTNSFTINTDLIRTTVVQHQNFAAQRMKDAVVDQFRDKTGSRPEVDNKNPDITLHLLIKNETGSFERECSSCKPAEIRLEKNCRRRGIIYRSFLRNRNSFN